MLAEAEMVRLRYEVLDERIAARKDPVTGLLNGRGFAELGAVLAADPASWPLVAVVVEIENFKQITLSFGQNAADKVLVAIGRRLGDYAVGPVVARLDGTKFAALLTSTIAGDGRHYPHVRELGGLLTEPVWAAGRLFRLRVSIGIANVADPGDLETALSKAETANRTTAPEFDQANRIPVQFMPSAAVSGTLAPVYYRSRIIARHHRRHHKPGRAARATNLD
jgi:diguanylate cyclase (GGDEF)-like protein